MPPTFVLDSDVLIAIQRAALESEFEKAGRLPVVVTAIVWDEVVGPAATQSKVVNLKKMLTANASAPAEFELESEEARIFAALQKEPRSEGPGEHSVIAHALTHRDAVPVLIDKLAIKRAVEELRGPVLSLFGFLGALVEAGNIPAVLAEALAKNYASRNPPARAPLWWQPRPRAE